MIHLPSRRRITCAALAVAFAVAPAGIVIAAPGGVPGKPTGTGPGPGAAITPPGRPANPGAPAPAGVPAGISTPGLAAGTGTVRVHEYVDLGDLDDARAHQRLAPALLQEVADGGIGTLVLRPLVLGRDANSVEAARALIAAARQNRAWSVAGHLVTARTEGAGDWITPATLRAIGQSVTGLAVARFLRDASSRSAYPQLNAIRREARAAQVTVTPAFVVKGPRGTRVVRGPARASEVLSAVDAVR